MSLTTKYESLRNTYYYAVESDQGEANNDEIGDFEILIPTFPFPEHQAGQVAIFTLTDFFITGMTSAARVSTAANGATGLFDISGFFVEINGLSLRPQNYNTFKSSAVRGTKSFMVINRYAKDNTGLTGGESCLAGQEDINHSVICGNPAGEQFRIKVFSLDTGDQLADQATLKAVIKFKIELLPAEISNGLR